MFVERVTAPRAEFDEWHERLRLVSDPPSALVASFSWETDGEVTTINVWDSPDAIADFFIERVHAIVEQHGPPAHKPQRVSAGRDSGGIGSPRRQPGFGCRPIVA
jgi:hypothetical protein